mgnify:CR=1 FL=1
MEALRSHNDSESQIFASMPNPNDETAQQAPNDGQQMMGDMQFAQAIEPILIESQGQQEADLTLSSLLDILQNTQSGNIPYFGADGQLYYEGQ